MPWKRGNASLEVEVSRLQGWVEDADTDLYGPDGDKGVVGEHRSAIAKKSQRDEDMGRLYKVLAWVASFAGGSLILQILRAFKVIP